MVVSDAGELCAIADTRYGAEPWVQAGDRIVECVPMPRVATEFCGMSWGEEQYAVMINGLSLLSGSKSYAMRTARDLRRALRGK